jgi:hypothetical protein
MTTDQWLTIGIYIASLVFGVVGWLIVREIRANDRRFDQLEKKLDRASDDSAKAKNETRSLRMFLVDKGVLPHTIRFPSPEPRIEDSE